MSNGTTSQGTTPPSTSVPVNLVAQTGMPPIHQNRSRELNYDALQGNPKFVKNPFGPQRLDLSRPQHHW